MVHLEVSNAAEAGHAAHALVHNHTPTPARAASTSRAPQRYASSLYSDDALAGRRSNRVVHSQQPRSQSARKQRQWENNHPYGQSRNGEDDDEDEDETDAAIRAKAKSARLNFDFVFKNNLTKLFSEPNRELLDFFRTGHCCNYYPSSHPSSCRRQSMSDAETAFLMMEKKIRSVIARGEHVGQAFLAEVEQLLFIAVAYKARNEIGNEEPKAMAERLVHFWCGGVLYGKQ
jgi:hypothetical protein